MGVVWGRSGRGLNIFARVTILEPPLLEILDPPLEYQISVEQYNDFYEGWLPVYHQLCGP